MVAMRLRQALLLVTISCGARGAAAPPPATAAARAPAAPAPATVTPWAPACADAMRQAAEQLGAEGLRYRYSDIVSCPSTQRDTSIPHYVHDACDDPGVDASFQAPDDPEHIYVNVEQLDRPSSAPHRGMMPWARQRASDSWTQIDDRGTRHLFRHSSNRIVLIRLIMDGKPTRKAQAFMDALRAAADTCLGHAATARRPAT